MALCAACPGAATAEEVIDDAAEISAAIANLTTAEADTIRGIYKQISRFNDTCQGDSGGPLFVKGDVDRPHLSPAERANCFAELF